MESKLLNNLEIIDYVVEKEFFKDKSTLECVEIGDGNINYVFKVFDKKTNKSLVIKQSDTLLRSSGRPLDINRSKIEYNILKTQYEIYPGSVPEVYYYDEEKSMIIMEDISSYKNLREELSKGNIYSHLSDRLSEFLAKTLLPTTDLVISRKEKKENVKKYTNPGLCDISEDLVFTEPYYNYKDRNIITDGLESFVEKELYKDEELIGEVLKLKDKFQTNSQALIHGDLHTGSIFVNDKGIKVIDPEFAFYGPIGYDIGNVWGNIIFALANSLVMNDSRKDSLYQLLEDTIDKTIDKLDSAYDKYITSDYFRNMYFKKYYLKEIISDSFGYAATEIIRRDVGDSKVKEITSIKDNDLRIAIDKKLILIGKYLIKNRDNIGSAKDLIDYIKKLN